MAGVNEILELIASYRSNVAQQAQADSAALGNLGASAAKAGEGIEVLYRKASRSVGNIDNYERKLYGAASALAATEAAERRYARTVEASELAVARGIRTEEAHDETIRRAATVRDQEVARAQARAQTIEQSLSSV